VKPWANSIRAGGASIGRRILRIAISRFCFIPIISGAYFMFVSSYLFVWFIDPYRIRGLASSVTLSDKPYEEDLVARFISIAARDGTDLVVVGGSTSVGFTSSDLRAAFPHIQKPANLAFRAIRINELATVLSRLEASDTLKHIIIAMDWTLLRPDLKDRRREMGYHVAQVWHNPVPEFHTDAVVTAARVLRTGSIDQPRWFRGGNNIVWVRDAPSVSSRPEALIKIRHAADVSRGKIASQKSVMCESLSALTDIVAPAVKRLAGRGIVVDLYFPPYSLAVYSDWAVNFPAGTFLKSEASVFDGLLALRRCTVELMRDVTKVGIHAFDTDLTLTSDMANYVDSTHLKKVETYQHVLQRIAARSSVLTKENWPTYEANFRQAVEEFRP
jgi:hypothetical protein